MSINEVGARVYQHRRRARSHRPGRPFVRAKTLGSKNFDQCPTHSAAPPNSTTSKFRTRRRQIRTLGPFGRRLVLCWGDFLNCRDLERCGGCPRDVFRRVETAPDCTHIQGPPPVSEGRRIPKSESRLRFQYYCRRFGVGFCVLRLTGAPSASAALRHLPHGGADV